MGLVLTSFGHFGSFQSPAMLFIGNRMVPVPQPTPVILAGGGCGPKNLGVFKFEKTDEH